MRTQGDRFDGLLHRCSEERGAAEQRGIGPVRDPRVRHTVGRGQEHGFTLIEVLVAVAVLVTGIAGVAQLAIVSARATDATRSAGTVEWLAREKLEQLSALAWTSDDSLVPIADYSTNLTRSPVLPAGGLGVSVSPGDTLSSSVTGYVDYLDAGGAPIAASGSPPQGAQWQRRWSIQLVAGQPDTLLLQVLVAPVRAPASLVLREAAARNGAWLTSLRVRRAR